MLDLSQCPGQAWFIGTTFLDRGGLCSVSLECTCCQLLTSDKAAFTFTQVYGMSTICLPVGLMQTDIGYKSVVVSETAVL